MKKKSILAASLEEAGLVEPASTIVTTGTDDGAEIDKLLEQQEADVDAFVDASAEINTVAEVKEGLESLVASMEAALVDPNYSPREYQLQVNHAQALLARIGCGVGAGLSCESTDGANDAKESFADKAKKLGKVIAESIRKFIAWLKEKCVAMRTRIQALAMKAKERFRGRKWTEGQDYTLTGLWKGAKFDPSKPSQYSETVLDVLDDYIGLISEFISDAAIGDKETETDSAKELYQSGCVRLFANVNIKGLGFSESDGISFTASDDQEEFSGKTTKPFDIDKVLGNSKEALYVLEKFVKRFESFSDKLEKKGTIEGGYFSRALGDARVLSLWGQQVVSAELHWVMAYLNAGYGDQKASDRAADKLK